MDVFVHLLPDLDMATLDFATINYLYADPLPALIGTERVHIFFLRWRLVAISCFLIVSR